MPSQYVQENKGLEFVFNKYLPSYQYFCCQTSDAGIWLSLIHLANVKFQTLFYYKSSPDTVSDIKMHPS